MKFKVIILSLITSCLFGQTVLGLHQYNIQGNDQEKPGQFKFTYSGQNPIEGSLTITNLNEEGELYMILGSVDGITNSTGSYSFKTADQEQTKIGKWLVFEEDKVLIKPLEKKIVRFKIDLPENITPGFYIGGISFQASNPPSPETAAENSSQGFSAKVQTRLLKKVFLNVPGEKITKYSLDNLTYNRTDSSQKFAFSIKNEGNSLLAANGQIEVKDQGNYLYNIPVKITGIMENETFKGDLNWNNPPKWGNFTATLNLEITEYDPFAEKYVVVEKVQKEVHFILTDFPSIYPYIAVGILLIFLLLVIIIEKILYRRGCIEYIVLENETIKSIAEKFGMNWKKLVSINHIKAPYELPAGKKILVRPKKNA